MLILGMGALARPDGGAVLAAARALAERYGMVKDGWNGFNVLHTAAGRVAGLDLGFLPGEGGRDLEGILQGRGGRIRQAAVFLLGADEIDMNRLGLPGVGPFVIYQGHHGDAGAHRADVILPGAAYTEKNATYVNTEGGCSSRRLASFPPGEAREDWTILRALSEVIGHKLPYDNLGELRQAADRGQSLFSAVDQVEPAAWGIFGPGGEAMGAIPSSRPIGNFYMTDPISRASTTMAECTEAFGLGAKGGATGTDG